MSVFDSLFSKLKKDYGTEKKQLTSDKIAERRKLAKDRKTRPEILFYLADDDDVKVRRSVAKNKATPIQVSDKLAKDDDVDVRLLLAKRLVELLPDLTEDMHSQLYAFAVRALGILAEDKVLEVRRALSSALIDHAYAPLSVVGQLARDVEKEISEPILRTCVRLSDDDILDILSHHPEPWVLSAIASRENLPPTIAEKIIGSDCMKAGTALLKNKKAKIDNDLLQNIVNKAHEFVDWHEPLALRPELSMELMRQLTGFVAERVLNLLQKRTDFDKQTSVEVAHLVKRRVVFKCASKADETVEEKVERYISKKKLTVDAFQDALAWREIDFVKMSLARVTDTHLVVIEKIFATHEPKPIVSLSWFAKMPVRFSIELQKVVGGIQPSHLIYARNGVAYAMSEKDMLWQLEFFGVDVTKNSHYKKLNSKK